MMFSGNSAITGPAIFTNQLDLCSWYTTYPPYFKEPSEVLRWSFISYKYESAFVYHSCYCIDVSGGFRGGPRGAVAPPFLKSQEVHENECIDIRTQ